MKENGCKNKWSWTHRDGDCDWSTLLNAGRWTLKFIVHFLSKQNVNLKKIFQENFSRARFMFTNWDMEAQEGGRSTCSCWAGQSPGWGQAEGPEPRSRPGRAPSYYGPQEGCTCIPQGSSPGVRIWRPGLRASHQEGRDLPSWMPWALL